MAIEVVATINSDPAERGAAQFRRALDSARPAVAGFDAGIGTVTRAVKALGAALLARELFQFGRAAVGAADDFTRLESRLNAIGTEGEGARSIMNALAEAAERARAPAADLTDIYARNAVALRNLGRSQAEGVRLTETLAKLGTIGGQGAESTTAALRQLSQSLASGAFRGEEFNSVAEQLPGIMQILSEQTGKSAGELRKLAGEGKLTADVLVNALLNASGQVDAQFGQMAQTADQAATVMADSVSRNFGQISQEVGVSAAWADAINTFNSAMGGEFAQNAMRLFAEGLAGAGRGAAVVIDALGEARLTAEAWYTVLSETAAFAAFGRALDAMGAGLDWIVGKLSAAASWTAQLFGAAAETVAPGATAGLASLATAASETEARLRAVAEWQTRVEAGGNIGSAAPATRLPTTFGAGDSGANSEKTLNALNKLIEQEKLRAQIAQARLAGDKALETSLETQLEIASRITPEMRAQHPELVRQLELHTQVGNEMAVQLERQSELLAENKRFADEFSSAITSGFANAVKGGQNFAQSLREVAARLIEIIAQAALLDPLQKSLSQSISSGLGDFNLSSIGSSLFSGFAFARGGVLNGPARFNSGGMSGLAGEAGPEGILPLRRGRNGELGVVATGGGGGGPTIVNINIDGDATDSTVAKMQRVAETVFSQRAPGVVKESVSAVRREHLSDANFLRR